MSLTSSRDETPLTTRTISGLPNIGMEISGSIVLDESANSSAVSSKFGASPLLVTKIVLMRYLMSGEKDSGCLTLRIMDMFTSSQSADSFWNLSRDCSLARNPSWNASISPNESKVSALMTLFLKVGGVEIVIYTLPI